jgi:hypothetical protein
MEREGERLYKKPARRGKGGYVQLDLLTPERRG